VCVCVEIVLLDTASCRTVRLACFVILFGQFTCFCDVTRDLYLSLSSTNIVTFYAK